MIVDDGGDATLLVHKGVEYEKAGVPRNRRRHPRSGLSSSACSNALRGPGLAPHGRGIKGVTEETTTGVHRLYEMFKNGTCCSRP
jgi:adenosylhomocysteinase